MNPERSGPGALAGATEADADIAEQQLAPTTTDGGQAPFGSGVGSAAPLPEDDVSDAAVEPAPNGPSGEGDGTAEIARLPGLSLIAYGLDLA
jgi:hypothetical protein